MAGRGREGLFIDLTRVNWVSLRRQKLTLVDLITQLETDFGQHSGGTVDDLDALTNLLDYIQDAAADVLGEEAVFGVTEETE